jgi:hypothetical protein
MIQDLSHLIPGSSPVDALVPTSQEATGSHAFDNRNAMTAPGGDPASAPGPEVSPPPHVDAPVHERTTVTHGGRPVIRMGQWNDLGGGGAPERR